MVATQRKPTGQIRSTRCGQLSLSNSLAVVAYVLDQGQTNQMCNLILAEVVLTCPTELEIQGCSPAIGHRIPKPSFVDEAWGVSFGNPQIWSQNSKTPAKHLQNLICKTNNTFNSIKPNPKNRQSAFMEAFAGFCPRFGGNHRALGVLGGVPLGCPRSSKREVGIRVPFQ